MQIYCIYDKCNFQGALKHLNKHLNTECNFHITTCQTCQTDVHVKMWANHESWHSDVEDAFWNSFKYYYSNLLYSNPGHWNSHNALDRDHNTVNSCNFETSMCFVIKTADFYF